jgi:hypothetical protein
VDLNSLGVGLEPCLSSFSAVVTASHGLGNLYRNSFLIVLEARKYNTKVLAFGKDPLSVTKHDGGPHVELAFITKFFPQYLAQSCHFMKVPPGLLKNFY